MIVLAFAIGYATGYPHTVRERVEMWKSPWDNHVHGGDQLADSLWSLSTGGATGQASVSAIRKLCPPLTRTWSSPLLAKRRRARNSRAVCVVWSV